MSARNTTLIVTGAPGTGKTTLARLLHEALGFDVVLESLKTHPFVTQYYGDPGRWSFHLSVFFLAQSAEAMSAAQAGNGTRPVCWDYDPRSHFEVYCGHLRSEGLISDPEYDTCARLHALLLDRFPAPDLLVFLRADAGLLCGRMHERGRTGEMATLSESYIERLAECFEDYLRRYTGSVCEIDTSQMNLDTSRQDQRLVLDLLARHLPDAGG